MRATIRASVVTGLAMVGALVIALVAPPPEAKAAAPPTVVHDVRLTSSIAPGAIPLAFLRNQLEYCSLICPHAVQGAITVPIAAVQTPVTFLGSLATTGSLFKAIGAAAASVTGPANDAVTPLIDNDVFLVVPKAFHALDVAVVEAFNVGAALLSPGQLLAAIETARTNILGALNQPVGPPTTPTGARNIFQVVAVSAIDVFTAVAFQAGELLLAGVVQVADAAAQELAQSGDPFAALNAGVTRAGQVINQSTGLVTSAVDTAVTNIRNSINDPFPSAPAVTSTVAAVSEEQAEPDTDKPAEKRSDKPDSDTPDTPDTPDALAKPEADKQSEDKPKDEPKDEPKADSKDEPKAEKDEPQSDARNEPKAESKDEPKAESKNEPKAEPKAESKDEPKSDKDDDSPRA